MGCGASNEVGKNGFSQKARDGQDASSGTNGSSAKESELADSAVPVEVCLAMLQVNASGIEDVKTVLQSPGRR
jgi:hypothetical protein